MTRTTTWTLSVLFLATITIWTLAFSSPSSNILQVTFCDVGQGDATLISLNKNQILVDGGSGKKVLDCLNAHLPLGDKTLELVLVTHPDKDHMGGIIEVFRHYQVKQFATVPVGKNTKVYQQLVKEIKQQASDSNFKLQNIYAGDTINIASLKATIVWPRKKWVAEHLDTTNLISNIKNSDSVLGATTTYSEINDFSVVLHLQYGNFDLLLNGDAGQSIQEQELEYGLVPSQVEVMNAPHHGSKYGISTNWLQIVNPQLSIISVGAKNRYGHPAPEILSRLQASDSQILRTDQLGDIVIETNGQNWWVK